MLRPLGIGCVYIPCALGYVIHYSLCLLHEPMHPWLDPFIIQVLTALREQAKEEPQSEGLTIDDPGAKETDSVSL